MTTVQAQTDLMKTKYQYWLQEGLFWILSLQALWATYQSIKLIFIQLPASEKKLVADTITTSEINFLVNDAIVIIFSTILSITVAAWFARNRSQQAQFFQNIIGFMAIVINFWLWQFLGNQNSIALIQPLADWLIAFF